MAISSTPPTTFLANVGVTDINRQSIWSSMDESSQQKYLSSSTSSSSTSTSSGTGSSSTGSSSTSSTTTTATTSKPKFSSVGSATALTPLAFDGRTDARSATPGASALTGFGNLWDGASALQAQLSADRPKGGAIFVNVQNGTAADGTRPADGKSGNVDNGRGKNPFGYFDVDNNFVRLRQGSDGQEIEVTYDPNSTTLSQKDWTAAARKDYDAFEAAVTKEMSAVTGVFGGQGLLGFDVNNNGFIDNETELFGFDQGLDINGSAYITNADGLKVDFTFLSGDAPADGGTDTRRLTGDPLDPNGQGGQSNNYRRFMVLNSSGESVSVLQSDVGYDAATRSYVKAQTTLRFGASGATITGVAQQGFSVSAVA